MNPMQFTITITPADDSRMFDIELERELHAFAKRLVAFYSRGAIPKVTLEKFEAITPVDALRFIADQAHECRDHDTHEALTLILPALMKILRLEPMNGYEADEFRKQFKTALQTLDVQPKEKTAAT